MLLKSVACPSEVGVPLRVKKRVKTRIEPPFPIQIGTEKCSKVAVHGDWPLPWGKAGRRLKPRHSAGTSSPQASRLLVFESGLSLAAFVQSP